MPSCHTGVDSGSMLKPFLLYLRLLLRLGNSLFIYSSSGVNIQQACRKRSMLETTSYTASSIKMEIARTSIRFLRRRICPVVLITHENRITHTWASPNRQVHVMAMVNASSHKMVYKTYTYCLFYMKTSAWNWSTSWTTVTSRKFGYLGLSPDLKLYSWCSMQLEFFV